MFSGLCKKEKTYLLKRFIFSIEFIFYTRHTTNLFFMKQLCECVAHEEEDVCSNFLF
jgi:hypothetical protein